MHLPGKRCNPLTVDGLYDRAAVLWEHFWNNTRPADVGTAKNSKVLYLVRPGLFRYSIATALHQATPTDGHSLVRIDGSRRGGNQSLHIAVHRVALALPYKPSRSLWRQPRARRDQFAGADDLRSVIPNLLLSVEHSGGIRVHSLEGAAWGCFEARMVESDGRPDRNGLL
jgi:hypothetical protein